MFTKLIKRHWRGELSLPMSYWLIGTVFGNVLLYVTVGLLDVIDSFLPSVTYTAWLLLFMYPVIWAILLWVYVGIWNSSTNYMASGKSNVWGYLAKFGVVMGLLQVSIQVTTIHLPIMTKMSQFAMGSDPMGTIKYEVLNDGHTLYISGVFGNGSSSVILRALEQNPKIKRLHLDSTGGRIKEVSRVASEVESRKLETYVEEQCLSACTVVFLAGSRRYSTPNARIGFHAPYLMGEHIDKDLMVGIKDLYRSFELPESFVSKIFATPSSEMWYPSHEELVTIGVVTNLSQGGETNQLQKSLNVTSVEDVKRFLLTRSIWQRLEKKFPGVLDEVSARMFTAMQAGKSDTDTLSASRQYITPYLMTVIAKSSPVLRAEFASLALDQSRYLATLGPEFCKAFLTSTLDLTKTLPDVLVQRELSISEEALDSDFVAPLNYSKEAYEQFLALVAAGVPEAEISAISNLNALPTNATCSGLVNFYKGIDNLPETQRDIVIYGMLTE